MDSADVPVAVPNAVCREEYDDWALLYDPDSGEVYGLNPVAAFIWRQVNGRRSVREIAALVRASFEDAPQAVEAETLAFVEKLRSRGFVGTGAR